MGETGTALPGGWVSATLSDAVIDIAGGGTPSRAVADYFGGEIPWFTPTEIQRGRITTVLHSRESINESGLKKSSAKLLPAGSVLLTSRATIGNVAIAGREVTTNQGFASIVCPPELLNWYVAYWFLSIRKQLNERATGTTFKEISKSKLRAFEFPLPPLPEQHRIVAKIEELFSDLDAGVEALKKVKAELKRYRQAVLKAAVEGKLTEEWRRRRGQGEGEKGRQGDRENEGPGDESVRELLERIRAERAKNGKAKKLPPIDTSDLPKLPDGWEWVPVEDLAVVGTGATPLRSKNEYYQGGTIPWVTSGAMNSLVVETAEEYVTERALKETNVKVFPKGSLLVAMYGEGKTRGKVSELRIDASTNQACAALVFDESTDACKPFVKLFFRRNYEKIRLLSSGGVQPNLNLSIIKKTLVPLPPLVEQVQIVSEVERRLSAADEVERTVEAGLKQAERLRQSILKRAFEGRLVPQDPNDPPASELLEKIKNERERRKNKAKKTGKE